MDTMAMVGCGQFSCGKPIEFNKIDPLNLATFSTGGPWILHL